jgi:hypothetical protein
MKRLKNLTFLRYYALTGLLVTLTINAKAQDWSQWRGSKQDGIVKDHDLLFCFDLRK